MTEEDRKPKVLIVEDEPETAEMFGTMLGLHGFQVLTVHGTGTAIGVLEREQPDAVLLDVMMPDISGLELCRYIRREPRLAELPVVIVSAKVRPREVAEGMEAGATAYLTKPVNREKLIETLNSALEKRRS